MNIPDKIWVLMSRSLSGEATANEQDELTHLLQEQPGLLRQYELLKQLWHPYQDQPTDVEPGKISRILQLSAVEEALQKQPENTITPHIVPWQKRVFRTAAIFAGLLLSVWAVTKWVIKHPVDKPGIIVSQKGTKTRTILPDGSTVWLNAGSRIEYDPAFANRVREVTLHGEAYFDVVKQTDRPFIVHAGTINIKVLGTAFNVKSYPGDGSIETTLIRGLVQVTRVDDTKQKPIYLHPNQKLILSELPETPVSEPSKTDNKPIAGFEIAYLDSNLDESEHLETAWVYNRLEFRGDNFIELAKKLERWYNITISFGDEQAKQLMFNGSIENETVEQAFEALRTAVPFNFKIKNNEVLISSN
jgi:ferric-dicitrate binding protein FerR (iron transport regulator)